METAEAIELLRRAADLRRFTDQPVSQAGLDDLLATVARWMAAPATASPGSSSSSATGHCRDGWASAGGYVGPWPVRRRLCGDGSNPDQVEQETSTRGAQPRLQLAAEAHGLGSAIGWSTARAGRENLCIPRERLVRTTSPSATRTPAPKVPLPPAAGPGSRLARSSITSDSARREPHPQPPPASRYPAVGDRRGLVADKENLRIFDALLALCIGGHGMNSE